MGRDVKPWHPTVRARLEEHDRHVLFPSASRRDSDIGTFEAQTPQQSRKLALRRSDGEANPDQTRIAIVEPKGGDESPELGRRNFIVRAKQCAAGPHNL